VLPTQPRSTECGCGATPVPDSDTAAGEFVALLTNETDPEKGPLMAGVNAIVTVLVPPAAIVIGNVNPVALNTPPVMLAAETVTDPVPVFESVTFWLAVLEVRMLPKAILVGETLSSCVAVTVTVAEAVLVISTTLFAVTVYVPAVLGAVYRPDVEIVPAVADQVTDVLLEPVTVTVNCCIPPVWMDEDVGLMDTVTGGGSTVTVTLADAVLLGSATLVAVTA
jgi:hypothetical protein